MRKNVRRIAAIGAATHIAITPATYARFKDAPFAIDKPASIPTSDMLSDIGALMRWAIRKTTTATSKASALNCRPVFGNRAFTVFVIPMP